MIKQKSNVLLLEIIVVTFFLSLLSVLLLQLFSTATIISVQDEQRSDALAFAQDWAEQVRGATNIDALLEQGGWEKAQGEEAVSYTLEEGKTTLSLTGTVTQSAAGTLQELTLRATSLQGETLAALPLTLYRPLVQKEAEGQR